MANAIVKAAAKKVGISEPVAQVAVNTVSKLLKPKLPSTAGSALNTFLGSSSKVASKKSSNSLGNIGSIAGALGGLFGKK